MQFLQQLTGRSLRSESPPSSRSAKSHRSARSTRSHRSARSHRSGRESTGRRVHAGYDGDDDDGDDGVSGVGTALVALSEAIAANAQPPDATKYATQTSSSRQGPFFLAVLAPSPEAARTFLATQPPGTYVLVKEGDELAVYVKFRQTVRMHVLIKSKEIKKQKAAVVTWGPSYRSLDHALEHAEALTSQPTLMTPLHHIYLPPPAYAHLVYCWTQFLPQVQAILFELCSESYYIDQAINTEDWGACILSARVPCVAFLSPENCGFYLFNTSSTCDPQGASGVGSQAGSLSSLHPSNPNAIPVRHIEIDFAACVLSITDGTFRPHAFVSGTHFASKKQYDPGVSFRIIRENFFTPDRASLREVTVTVDQNDPNTFAKTLWHDGVSESSVHEDALSAHLASMRDTCAGIIPHEPFPASFISQARTVHDQLMADSTEARWSIAKIRLVSQILPYYLELFLSTATPASYTLRELRVAGQTNYLPLFAAAMRFDIVRMAQQLDETRLPRLVHHIVQVLMQSYEPPAAFVRLIGELFATLPSFRALFIKLNGQALLWRVLVRQSQPKPASSRSVRTPHESTRAILTADHTRRRSSLFRAMRQMSTARSMMALTRPSFLFNASTLNLPTFEENKQALVFFLVNPLLAQLEIAPQLRECHFPSTQRIVYEEGSRSSSNATRSALIQFILGVATHLLEDLDSPYWDRDVAVLLRLDGLYEQIHEELERCLTKRNVDEAAHQTRLAVLVGCISSLYRLELVRRRFVMGPLGEKQYFALLHTLRLPLRTFYDQVRAAKDEDSAALTDTMPTTEQDTILSAMRVLTQLWPRMPTQLLTDAVLLTLSDLLDLATVVYDAMDAASFDPLNVGGQILRHILHLVTIALRRTHDFDLQMLLLRIVSSSGACMPAIVRQLIETASNAALENELLQFCRAFITQSTNLPRLEYWSCKLHNEVMPAAVLRERADDHEAHEQRKTLLMAAVLSPENGIASSSDVLTNLLPELLFPTGGNNGSSPTHASNKTSTLRVVARCATRPLAWALQDEQDELRIMGLYLDVLAHLYVSPLVDPYRASTPRLASLVELHFEYVQQLRISYATQQLSPSEERECLALIQSHLRCLVALASRRSESSVVSEAFSRLGVVQSLVQALTTPSEPIEPPSDLPGDNIEVLTPPGEEPSEEDADKANEARAPRFTLNLARLNASNTTQRLLSKPLRNELLLHDPAIHSLACVIVFTSLVWRSNELDHTLTPRFALAGGEEEPSKTQDGDLLWTIQQHLAQTTHNANTLRTTLHECEFDGLLGSPARAASVRVLMRLLLPDTIDTRPYATNNHDGPLPGRAYISKGAFATVYRASSALQGADAVAIKVLAHQKRPGDLSVVADLFYEVSALERLCGNVAATRLLDAGNRRETESAELVLEYCPSTLNDWRRALTKVRLPPLLALTLSVFREVAVCLQLVHNDGVCHFDIKADNVLLRQDVVSFTRELLELVQSSNNLESVVQWLRGRICLGDFGESVVLHPCESESVILARTRGTEAIKSPEMLQVKGPSRDAASETPVGPRSDVWSLGCLLYELLTQELMFGHDDWSAFFAHLLSSDAPIVRESHRVQLHETLAPSIEEEEHLIDEIIALLTKIMKRNASERPCLDLVITETTTLLGRVMVLAQGTTEACTVESPAHANLDTMDTVTEFAALRSPPATAARSNGIVSTRRGIARMFWNWYVVDDLKTLLSRTNPDNLDEALKRPRRWIQATVESALEPHFSHFVYVQYADAALGHSNSNTSSPTSTNVTDPGFLEFVEELEIARCCT
ncbi:hypothetical protein Poli38472_011615 [Pythium oligandrum]|uniref:Protein kinase domain-containing protein n=1 Tax=Pythium oligandrum TaxID=41045 RepID=A0A8K1CK53_PYTOL|nr:hypothetical protein Poli38472_011615 [Pythium oligandrum]|eukprot:TMW64735.1 hypothetical protein Poli38472_011615 [Pythium oligandrum]